MEETADGGYKVRLGLGLSIREKEPAPAVKAFRSGRPGSARQRSMTSLGLLHALREAAQVSRWHPGFRGKRGPSPVAWWLSATADQFRVVRTELAELFAPVTPDRRGGAARLEQMTRDFGRRRRLVILRIFTAVEPVKFGRCTIRLTGGPGVGLFLSALSGQADALLTKHSCAARVLRAAPEERGRQVMVVFVVKAEPGEWNDRAINEATMQGRGADGNHGRLQSMASDPECQVANDLVAEGRAFTKPLRYDVDTDLVLPDFVLTHTGVASGWPMEVFGRVDAD